jgi:hypothetical protein
MTFEWKVMLNATIATRYELLGVVVGFKFCSIKYIWASPWQNQCNVFATSMYPDQPAQSDQDPCCSLTNPITIANSRDPDQNALMRRLVWIHAGRKCITLVLSSRGSFKSVPQSAIFDQTMFSSLMLLYFVQLCKKML